MTDAYRLVLGFLISLDGCTELGLAWLIGWLRSKTMARGRVPPRDFKYETFHDQ